MAGCGGHSMFKGAGRCPIPLSALALFLAGGALGALAKWLDVTSTFWGDLFSQMSVWVLLGVLMALASATPARAAVHVLCFCVGMLLAYYWLAQRMQVGYSQTMFAGWLLFALFSPIFAGLVWHVRRGGPLARLLSVGVLLFQGGASLLLFGKLHVTDWVCILLTGWLLFFGARTKCLGRAAESKDGIDEP